MSEDPRVGLISAAFGAWERGDVEGTVALCDPDIEIYAPPEIGNPGTFRGIEALLGWAEAWYEAWESFEQELVALKPVGRTHALGTMHQTGRGRGSGISLEREATWVCEVRGGKLVYLALFWDRDRALALVREREREASD